jgi:hypothetical protein
MVWCPVGSRLPALRSCVLALGAAVAALSATACRVGGQWRSQGAAVPPAPRAACAWLARSCSRSHLSLSVPLCLCAAVPLWYGWRDGGGAKVVVL